MKILRKVPVELVECEFIPEVKLMEEGKFYYSEEYRVANHLCFCGCLEPKPIPIREGEWSLTINSGKVTITPSLLHTNQCMAHYVIENGFAIILTEGREKGDWYNRFETHAPGACPM